MKVLVACEMSGRVRDAFIRRGHDAFSCDVLPTLSNPDRHIQSDVRKELVRSNAWDLIIAHPPCTALCVSGNRHYVGTQARQDAIEFFDRILHTDCPKICVENPVGVISTAIRKPDQYIQPWQFGHPESKKTGLWLHGLPKLVPTNILDLPECGYWDNQTPSGQNKLGPSEDRAMIRSLTYQGIADAMAEQWG